MSPVSLLFWDGVGKREGQNAVIAPPESWQIVGVKLTQWFEPSTAAGSGTPQFVVIGLPGQTGHTCLAVSSQTVKTRSISKFTPVLAAQSCRRQLGKLSLAQRHRVDCAFGLAAGAIGSEGWETLLIHDCLGHDGTCRVTGAWPNSPTTNLRGRAEITSFTCKKKHLTRS